MCCVKNTCFQPILILQKIEHFLFGCLVSFIVSTFVYVLSYEKKEKIMYSSIFFFAYLFFWLNTIYLFLQMLW